MYIIKKMSVLKNLRALSEMQFYKTAITIRKELTIWLLKDFGTRRNAKSVNQIIKDITPEVITPVKATITRERRKLRKLKARLDNGLITKAKIEAQYKSWRGTLEKYDTCRRLRVTDALYHELFKG